MTNDTIDNYSVYICVSQCRECEGQMWRNGITYQCIDCGVESTNTGGYYSTCSEPFTGNHFTESVRRTFTCDHDWIPANQKYLDDSATVCSKCRVLNQKQLNQVRGKNDL